MRKMICLISLCVNSFMYSQNNISVGLKSGVTIADQSGHSFSTKPIFSPNCALFCDFMFNRYFSVSSELGYVQKGFKESIEITTVEHPEGTGDFMQFSNRLNYLSLSVGPKVCVPLTKISPYLYIAPRYDQLLSKDLVYIYTNDPKSYSFSLFYALGIETKEIFPFAVLAELSYNSDLTDLYGGNVKGIKNRVYEIRLGARLK